MAKFEYICLMMLIELISNLNFSPCPFSADVEDKISMNMLLYDHHDDDFDIVRRKAAGLILKSMNFENEGL